MSAAVLSAVAVRFLTPGEKINATAKNKNYSFHLVWCLEC
jgi:hypothetical protein